MSSHENDLGWAAAGAVMVYHLTASKLSKACAGHGSGLAQTGGCCPRLCCLLLTNMEVQCNGALLVAATLGHLGWPVTSDVRIVVVCRILQHLRSQSSTHGSWYIGAEHASQHLCAIEDGVVLVGRTSKSKQWAAGRVQLQRCSALCHNGTSAFVVRLQQDVPSALARGPTLRSTCSPAATGPIA